MFNCLPLVHCTTRRRAAAKRSKFRRRGVLVAITQILTNPAKFNIAALARHSTSHGTHFADELQTTGAGASRRMQEQTMDTVDYVKPADVAAAMVEAGKRKLALAPRDLLIRGMLSGAILGVATSLAFTGRSEERRVGKECRSRWSGDD